MNIIRHGVFILVLFLNTLIAKAQDSIFLRLRLVKGENYEYTYSRWDTIQGNTSFLFLRHRLKVPHQSIAGTLMIIKDIDSNGNYVLEAEQNKLRLTLQIPFIGTVNYDSDSSGFNKNLLRGSVIENIYNNEFSAVLHHPFKIILSSSGKVISVSGMKQVMEAVKDSLESVSDLSMTQKDQIFKNLSKDYNDLAYKSDLNSFFDVYPDHRVAIGDQWKKELFTGIVNPERDTYYYSLKNIRGDSVFIDVKGDIYSPGDTAANGTPTLMTGTLTGTLILDKNTGVILEERTYSYATGTDTFNKKIVKTQSSSKEVDEMKLLSPNAAKSH